MSTTHVSTTHEDFNVKEKQDSGNWFDAYNSNILATPTNVEPDPVPSTVILPTNDNPAPDLIPSASNMMVPFTAHGKGPLKQPLPDEQPSTPSGKKQKTSDAKPMEDDVAYL